MRYQKRITHAALITMIVISAAGILGWVRSYADTPRVLRENPDSFIRSRMNECFANGGRNNCYRDIARELLARLSPKEILASFEAQESSPEIFSRCHEVAHYVGRAAYAEAQSVPLAYEQCTSACHGGCYHGVMEEYLKEKNVSLVQVDDAAVSHEIYGVCGSESDHKIPRTYWECFHGIGHALMFVTDSNLLRSLRLCDTLSGQGQIEACWSGVFMENSSSSTNLDHPSKYIDADDPMYPCTILDQKYLKLCYQYQSSYFAEITHWQWEDTINLCRQVPMEYREGCFHIIGTNQVGYTQDNDKRKQTCDLIADTRFRKACVSGIVSSLGGRYVGQPDHMRVFCALANTEDREICYRQMGVALHSWGTDSKARKEICDQIVDPAGVGWCLLDASSKSQSFVK